MHSLQALLFAGLTLLASVQGVAAQQVVLILNTFDSEDHIHAPAIDGIREALSSRIGLKLIVEHLDATHADPVHLEAVQDLIGAKHQDKAIDVIVTLGREALDYAIEVRDPLFGNAPIVFGEVPNLPIDDANAILNASGVIGGYRVDDTLRLMRDLHADRRNILVVDDELARGHWLRDQLDFARASFPELTFQETAGQSAEQIERKLETLDDDDAILFLSATQSADGINQDFHGAVARISRLSPVPVYGSVDSVAGFGVVGGYMFRPHKLGKRLGTQVNQILDGASADDLTIETSAPHDHIFDFRQLQRFGIRVLSLPRDSIIIDEPDTLYYRYKQYLFAAAAFFVGLLIYIAILISGNIRREKAKNGLERLLRVGEAQLPIERASEFLTETTTRLAHVIPSIESVGTYRLVEGGDLAPLAFSSQTSPSARPDQKLISEFRGAENPVFSGKDALLPMSATAAPDTLIHCRASRPFDAIERRLLDLLIRNIEIGVENQNASMLSASLAAARDIQRAMLRQSFESEDHRYGVDLAASLYPAKDVGGDLYDVFEIDRHRVAFLIGDVSGKGVPAAIFMSMTLALIRGLAANHLSPVSLLRQLNDKLSENNEQMLFVTLLLCVFDTRNGELTFVNAGHEAPVVFSENGGSKTIELPPNLALGIMEDVDFSARTITLSQDEGVLLYTDGVTDARNEAKESFGPDRILATMNAHSDKPAQGILDTLNETVAEFIHGVEQYDDVTLVVFKQS